MREESGLWGCRHVDRDALGKPVAGFNFDGRLRVRHRGGAVGADRWAVEIFGRAAHAGGAPERGISATMILGLALAEIKAGGWFGKVVKGKKQGTSNVGPVSAARPAAGDATNVVTDYVHVRGESRSHDPKFFKQITAAYKAAFEKAAKRVKNSEGKTDGPGSRCKRTIIRFGLRDSLPVVKRAAAAVAEIGGSRTSAPRTAGWMRTGWFATACRPSPSAPARTRYTVDEWINLDEFERACTLAVRLATMR